jgi:hypothetical protein
VRVFTFRGLSAGGEAVFYLPKGGKPFFKPLFEEATLEERRRLEGFP